MTEKAKKLGIGTLKLGGYTIQISAIVAFAYSYGQRDEHLKTEIMGISNQVAIISERITLNTQRIAASEAVVMKTREGLDDKLTILIRSVGRLEGKLDRGAGRLGD